MALNMADLHQGGWVREGRFGTHSDQCLRNMVRFSLIRGTRRGDPI